MKQLLTSAIMGVLALLAVNLTAVFTGVGLGVNALSLGVSSVLGIPGVISMLIIGAYII